MSRGQLIMRRVDGLDAARHEGGVDRRATSTKRGVIATNLDAAESKYSAISKGYWEDRFLGPLLVAANCALPSIPRMPMINRGTFTRARVIEKSVEQFLRATANSEHPRQIVSLGAGFDTLYFRLASSANPQLTPRDRFIEVDLPEVAALKAAAIARAQPALLPAPPHHLAPNSTSALRLQQHPHLGGYALLAADLRKLPSLRASLFANSSGNGRVLECHWPTLIITELVLVYLEADWSDALIEMFGAELSGELVWLNLEQVSPVGSAFGAVMRRNLEARQCALLGVETYATVESQRERFCRLLRTRTVCARRLLDAYAHLLDADERRHAERLELLDEVEEWNLMMSHYCVVIAARYREGSGVDLSALVSE